MKVSADFILREVADTWVVMPLRTNVLDFSGMVRLNNSGAMLWKILEEGASRDELIQAMIERYDVSEEQAERDLDEFLGVLNKVGCLV